MTGYVPFNRHQIDDVLCVDMGFTLVDIPQGSREFVYERDVVTKSGVSYPYKIRVYSSVRKDTNWTDECGADAIRVVLMDKVTGTPAAGKQKRVHRTKNAMGNLRQRCRDLFKMVLEAEKCPRCEAIMVERENRKTGQKFLSCTHFRPGAEYHCVETKQIEREAA